MLADLLAPKANLLPMLSAARLRHDAKVICGARVIDLIMADIV